MPKSYMTIAGDMWDYIAMKTLGSEKYMHDLMAANLQYREITVFGGGVDLVIPEIKAAKLGNLPPWRK